MAENLRGEKQERVLSKSQIRQLQKGRMDSCVNAAAQTSARRAKK